MKRVVVLVSTLGIVLLLSPVTQPAHATGEPGDGTPCVEGDEVPTYRDVVYAQSPQGVDLELDVWIPPGAGPFPSLLLIHGAWGHGDKLAYDGWSEDLCHRGFVVFNSNYRAQCTQDEPPPNPYMDYEMCQGAVAPDQVDDLELAMLWVRSNASEYNGDPERVGSVGASGGGTLASMLGVERVGDARPDVVVTWSGLLKLWVIKGSSDEERIGEATARYVGCPFKGPGKCPGKWAANSAVTHVSPDDPPFYVANGVGETIPLLQAKAMHQALLASGVTHTYRVVPEPLHGRQYEFYEIEPGYTVLDETLDFLHEHLGF